MGCTNPIGFFLHIPMPPPPIMAAIPEHEWLMRSLFAYDLVGFQTESDLLHFEHYVEAEAGAARLPDGRLRAFGHTLSAGAFPIGINVDEFESLARDRDGLDMFERMRDEYSRRQLLVGVDRLDYTKGLPQRVHAFRQLLEQYPENRNRATLIQIAAPSREDLGAYDDLRREMDSPVARSTATTANLNGCRCATFTAPSRASACRVSTARAALRSSRRCATG